VVREDGSIVNYKYDGLGRRIEKEVDAVVTQYIYDNTDILLELDGSKEKKGESRRRTDPNHGGPAPPISRELKRRCSHFIREVYETDPFVCAKCSGEMSIISFIDQGAVIKKILEHLGLWE